MMVPIRGRGLQRCLEVGRVPRPLRIRWGDHPGRVVDLLIVGPLVRLGSWSPGKAAMTPCSGAVPRPCAEAKRRDWIIGATRNGSLRDRAGLRTNRGVPPRPESSGRLDPAPLRHLYGARRRPGHPSHNRAGRGGLSRVHRWIPGPRPCVRVEWRPGRRSSDPTPGELDDELRFHGPAHRACPQRSGRPTAHRGNCPGLPGGRPGGLDRSTVRGGVLRRDRRLVRLFQESVSQERLTTIRPHQPRRDHRGRGGDRLVPPPRPMHSVRTASGSPLASSGTSCCS